MRHDEKGPISRKHRRDSLPDLHRIFTQHSRQTAQYHIGSVCRMAIGSSCLHETIAVVDQNLPERACFTSSKQGFRITSSRYLLLFNRLGDGHTLLGYQVHNGVTPWGLQSGYLAIYFDHVDVFLLGLDVVFSA